MSKKTINIKNNITIKKIYSNYFFTALLPLFFIIACAFLALTSEDLKYAKRIYFFVLPFLFIIFLFYIIKSIIYFRIGIRLKSIENKKIIKLDISSINVKFKKYYTAKNIYIVSVAVINYEHNGLKKKGYYIPPVKIYADKFSEYYRKLTNSRKIFIYENSNIIKSFE